MCGIQQIICNELLQCIKTAAPVMTKLPSTWSGQVFMIAKQQCPYSQRAWKEIQKHIDVKKNSDRVTIIDGNAGNYLCCKSFKPLEPKDEQLSTFLKVWNDIKQEEMRTYPDIYYFNNNWHRVGGCTELLQAVTVLHTDDLLHLLPKLDQTSNQLDLLKL